MLSQIPCNEHDDVVGRDLLFGEPFDVISWQLNSLAHVQLLNPAEQHQELDIHGLLDVIGPMPWAVLDHRHLRQGHASLAKRLVPQRHHLWVAAREGVLYPLADHLGHAFLDTFVKDVILVPLPRLVPGSVGLP